MKQQGCLNFNHGRRDPPVRACPMCGGVVNAKVPAKRCSDGEHADRRRSGNAFCIDCGLALRVK